MRTYQINYCQEDLKSRVLGLFPYLEENEIGSFDLHKATDSVDGCFGKIMECIKLPSGVFLSVYVEIDYTPNKNTWKDNIDSFEYGVKVPVGVKDKDITFIRNVIGFSYEEITDLDTFGTNVPEFIESPYIPIATQSSSDYVKVPILDAYGEKIEGCIEETLYRYYQKIKNYKYYKAKNLLLQKNTYTYPELRYYYYQYRNRIESDNPFIAFIDRGIGRIVVDKKKLGLTDYVKYSQVPNVLYLAEAADVLQTYIFYKNQCDKYNALLKQGVKNAQLCCDCEHYTAIGGDIMLNYIQGLIKQAEDIAEEYYTYAEKGCAFFNINIFLSQTMNDLGYLSQYDNQFIAGEKYYHGELVTYNERTYVCDLLKDNSASAWKYVLAYDDIYMRSIDPNNPYMKIDVVFTQSVEVPTDYVGDFVYNKKTGRFFTWFGGRYIEETNLLHSYTTGMVDEETKLLVFDTKHFTLLTDYFGNGIYNEDNTYGDRYSIYKTTATNPELLTEKDWSFLEYNNSYYQWNNFISKYEKIKPEDAEYYRLYGKTNSQLKTLKIDDYIIYTEQPQEDESWLCLYTKNVIINGKQNLDKDGNIIRDNGFQDAKKGDVITDLQKYGTLLYDVRYDKDNKKVIFEYIVDAHLLGVFDGKEEKDEHTYYYYSDFMYDPNDKHGIKFIETYDYEDEDIDMLIFNGDFDAYMNGDEQTRIKYLYNKFVFNTSHNTQTVVYDYGNETPSSKNLIIGEYEYKNNSQLDMLYSPLFRKDYFIGLSREPKVLDNIDINRGFAGAYERWLKLGEVKTFESLEEYSNGGFFNLRSDF